MITVVVQVAMPEPISLEEAAKKFELPRRITKICPV